MSNFKGHEGLSTHFTDIDCNYFLFQDHCFYHGHVRGHPDSWVALSTCSGVRYSTGNTVTFKRQNKDYGKTKARIMEIANYVDKFYRALNIRVPLIGLEVWTDRDQCIVTEEPNATLWSFLQWRQKLKSRKKHDNAQLLTGVIFKGTTIGMAPLEGMCSLENSGGINVDHSEVSIGAAATMAHEIGHNFGMSHDHDGCCVEATAEQGGCVMAAATGHPFPRVFSRCSKRDLDSYFQKGGGMCLFNMPNMKDLVGGKKCGNGFVEDGEECDCGEPDECTNDCCNANNCTLKEEAQCAHGVCCEGCKLKQAGTMCRGPAGACDLPEYCTGASPYCPANVYLLDGSSCQYGVAYCYNGMCLTHEQQCLQLWGYGARPAHDACFEDVNAAGNAFGNCGKDEHGNYMKCEKSDAKCGKIQCHSAAKKPKGTNAVSIDTTIKTDGIEVKCRGTYVYSTQDGQGDLPDPGLVMTGTKCGESKVCKDRRCQNASFTELETCIARCRGKGVCNSNGNCHCNRGWAPPFCEKPGLGGSVDSGPVQYDSESHTHTVKWVNVYHIAGFLFYKTVLRIFSKTRLPPDKPKQQHHVYTLSVGDVQATRAAQQLFGKFLLNEYMTGKPFRCGAGGGAAVCLPVGPACGVVALLLLQDQDFLLPQVAFPEREEQEQQVLYLVCLSTF
uniref:ADAM metallopeptidase domain 19a n=1 Tax=Sander lucioperca TaxID=283035 RepID=A0A8C9XN23_SANLU